MKKNISLLLVLFLLSSCVGSSSGGVFGTGVSVALDPRTLGTQIDDSIMQKNLLARLALTEKKYLVSLNVKVLDGRIFLGGKVEEAEEKLRITKMAWETKGARSVKNNISIKQKFSFKNTAIDVLNKLKDEIEFSNVTANPNVSKISVVGVGMRSQPGVAKTMFTTLADKGINIQVISTSEIKVSVLIASDYTELAVRALHSIFELDKPF